MLILNQDYKGIFSIRVNPNYLKEFPLYDELGNQVVIDEQTKDRILLVQAQYKEFEREILDFFEENQWLTYEFDQNNFSKETTFPPNNPFCIPGSDNLKHGTEAFSEISIAASSLEYFFWSLFSLKIK